MDHSNFKDIFAFQLLKHYEALTSDFEAESSRRNLRSDNVHNFVHLNNEKGLKRRRIACRACVDKGVSGEMLLL